MVQHEERLVRATLIYTLQQILLKQQSCRPIEHPGKYFNGMLKRWGSFGSYEAACEVYVSDKANPGRTTAKIEGIPEDIQDLVEEFSTWTYTDITQEVRLRMLAGLNGVWSSNVCDQGNVCTQQAALEPRVPEQWMESEEEAQQLAAQILREAPLIEADLRIQQIHRYGACGKQQMVFLVDVLQEGHP